MSTKTPKDSPALMKQSEHYPASFEGRVPLRVRLTETVRSELPFPPFLRACSGEEHPVLVNSHGAVALLLMDGSETLGVKPDEFEVVEWHQFPEVCS